MTKKRSLALAFRLLLLAAAALAVAAAAARTARPSTVTLPPGNTVEQWNKIAEDTVVTSGAFQNEGFQYMAYESTAVYDAAVSLGHGYKPLRPTFRVWRKASSDAAEVEAAYRTLLHYFPSASATLGAYYGEALAAIPDGPAKLAGQKIGRVASDQVIRARTGDGLQPIASTSTFPTLPPGPGVWRLTPSAYQAPQTPWVGDMKPFIMQSATQFMPGPPPSLSSADWVAAFNELKAVGGATSTVRTPDETNVAKFYTANVIRQYNIAVRAVTDARNLSPVDTARLAAMVNVVGADTGITVMHAKYHYLFWRPVTAIDPTSVTADGFGSTPGSNDGNAATIEQPGWRPLIATPNHPEYPCAHCSITSAMAQVFAAFLGTNQINLDLHGFDPNGPAGNLNAVRHFSTVDDLRTEVANARMWGGVHYRFSTVAGLQLGHDLATYDLAHAFGKGR
ncbi:MAG TPA: vanadium-dependent haloperoxidase [Gaiellaceae bacterium]|jgi:PAP2 superfamily|nr:vanadium-dependent haloperoxidase [Gaiellaceae bacterium]